MISGLTARMIAAGVAGKVRAAMADLAHSRGQTQNLKI